MEQENDKSLFGLSVDSESRNFLTESAKWAKFLAILGFIFCVLIALAGVAVSMQTEELDKAFSTYGDTNPFRQMGPAIVIIYIAIAVIYFFPCLYLLRFSNKMKVAMATDDQSALTVAFRNLKSMFKFIGILTIIIIAVYLLAIVFIAVSGSM